MTPSAVLIVGSRRDREPIGLAGLLAGNRFESTSPRTVQDQDAEEGDRELVERFTRFCSARQTQCVWLRRMQDASLTACYDVSRAALQLSGLASLEGRELRQEAIQG